MDVDAVKLEIARSDAAAQQVANVEFRLADITGSDPEAKFDFAHARFLLSQLPTPTEALAAVEGRPVGVDPPPGVSL